MTALAPSLQAFFTTRLGLQRDASPHTVDSYRHAFRLLLAYAKAQTGKAPSDLDLADLDAGLISSFLGHLEHDRANSVGTRNTRLAAVHSFFRFASYRHPEHAESIQQVLAIPQKKTERHPRAFLTQAEMDALLAAPDRTTWFGRRDHALLAVPEDGSAVVGADRPATPGRRARHGRTPQVHGRRAQASGHAAGQVDRESHPRLDARVRRRAHRHTLPLPTRRSDSARTPFSASSPNTLQQQKAPVRR
jgi:hypothetical protein